MHFANLYVLISFGLALLFLESNCHVCHRGLGECYGCGPPSCVKPAPLPKPHHFRKYCKEHLKKRFPKKCELDECDMCYCPPMKCKDKLGKKSLLGCKSRFSKCGDPCCDGCYGDFGYGFGPQECCFGNNFGNGCCQNKCKGKFFDNQCCSPALGYCPCQGRFGCNGNWRGVY